MENAYANGFFTADGNEETKYKTKSEKYKRIFLCGEKKKLLPKFKGLGISVSENKKENRININGCNNLKDKYFVPFDYCLKSKMEWLSGYADGDGSIRISDNQISDLSFNSINFDFLKKVQRMLQEIGVSSKMRIQNKEYIREFRDKNNPEKITPYKCKESYILFINNEELEKLIHYGFETFRRKMDKKIFQRNRSLYKTFIKVTEIEKLEGTFDTYCFTEPKRHMGVFNGILTGNCTEIMQISEVSEIKSYYEEDVIRRGISCNLGSLNIATVMENKRVKEATRTAIDTLTTVSDLTNIDTVPTIKKANEELHSVGLGAMNLHGYLAKNYIMYESREALDFCNVFFMMVNFYSLERSMEIAIEKGETFKDFDKSEYANGNYFEKYITKEYLPQTEKVKKLFEGIHIPNIEDWKKLKEQVVKNGIYNAYRMAIAPNQSTSYIMNSTASVMPVVDTIEVREYGDSTTYYPMPYLTNDNWFFYKSAYDMDQKNIINLISVIQRHVDQGISTILYNSSADTTRDLAKLYIYAHRMGLKSLYYTRTRKATIEECLSCSV